MALCESFLIFGASWGEDDKIVYGEAGKGIMRVSANGGAPETLVKLTGLYMVAPQILPDNRTLLFGHVTAERSQVVAQSLESGEQKVLIEGDSARYLPTGHLVYMVGNSLTAVHFDLDKLEVGGPLPIINNIFRMGATSAPHFVVSDSGTLVYIPGKMLESIVPQRTLAWVDFQGKEDPIAAEPNNYVSPRISPDGTKVALNLRTENTSDIWIWDLFRENLVRLTFNERSSFPLWTRDGQRIAFSLDTEESRGVYWKAANGGFDPLWSPDGRRLFFRSPDGIMAVDVETDRTFNAGKPKALFQYANIGELDIHPDGKRFLIIKEAEAVGDSSASQIPVKINIVTNWFEELKDRVPIN